MFPTTIGTEDAANFVYSVRLNTMIMEETEDDPLFAPINDMDGIFDDEPVAPRKSPLVFKMDASIMPTPLNEMSSMTVFGLEARDPYRHLRSQPADYIQSCKVSQPHKPCRGHQHDDFLLNALDEMDEATSGFFPHEIDALSDFSVDGCPNLSAVPERLPTLQLPKIPGLPSFKHLKPCLPKRRIVSDDGAYASLKPEKGMEPSKRSKSNEGDAKFRTYQTEKWQDKFQELLDFKQLHGHCQVPHGYRPKPTLARWCKRQRYQYKLFLEEKPSTITHERVAALEQIGFVWDSHMTLWNDRLQDLQDFIAELGHANVPSTYPPNQKLAIWVKCQRRQYKLLQAGQPSNMTHERVEELNELGFVWEVRRMG